MASYLEFTYLFPYKSMKQDVGKIINKTYGSLFWIYLQQVWQCEVHEVPHFGFALMLYPILIKNKFKFNLVSLIWSDSSENTVAQLAPANDVGFRAKSLCSFESPCFLIILCSIQKYFASYLSIGGHILIVCDVLFSCNQSNNPENRRDELHQSPSFLLSSLQKHLGKTSGAFPSK